MFQSMLHNHNQDRYRILILDHQIRVRISNRTKNQLNAQTNNQTNNRTNNRTNARTNILIRDHNNHIMEMVNTMDGVKMVAVGQGVISTIKIKISEIKPMETKLKTNLFQPFTIHILLQFLVSM